MYVLKEGKLTIMWDTWDTYCLYPDLPNYVIYQQEEPFPIRYPKFRFQNKPDTEEENLSKLEKHLHKTIQGTTCTEEVTLPKLEKPVHKTLRGTTGT